jgi:hypothetical protein
MKEIKEEICFSFLNKNEIEWLNKVYSIIQDEKSYGTFIMNFNLVSRKIESRILTENKDFINFVSTHKDIGWEPIPNAQFFARYALIYKLKEWGAEEYIETVKRMLLTLEHREAEHFYRMLPFLPHNNHFVEQAEEILRTNSTDIFIAFSQNSPWPKENFDEKAWNRMILKSIFLNCSLLNVVGLQEKNNEELYESLLQYAKERKAAKRVIPHDLWVLLFPLLKENEINFITDYFKSCERDEKEIIIKALAKYGQNTVNSSVVSSRFALE